MADPNNPTTTTSTSPEKTAYDNLGEQVPFAGAEQDIPTETMPSEEDQEKTAILESLKSKGRKNYTEIARRLNKLGPSAAAEAFSVKDAGAPLRFVFFSSKCLFSAILRLVTKLSERLCRMKTGISLS